MTQSPKNNSEIRVRFAPSPTGHLHIGGLRSALFNWLFARRYGGLFLLRIEDTDLERSKQEYANSILEAFAWCTIVSDEPIVIQSERRKEHVALAQRLVAEGKAYRCYCTHTELAARLGLSAAEGGFAFYDGKCRDRVEQEDKPFVIRCKVPREAESVTVHDLIRGDIQFPLTTIDDFIIVRSDSSPMYNLVVVADDAHMRISHVIRGEEHLVNTPRQIILYNACNFKVPQFAHIPLILGPDGSKLSKRDAATAVVDYKKDGYLADALCNYLVRLGWSHGDQEIFTRQEMIDFFSLDQVHKSGAIFDPAKLIWMNQVYIKQLSAEDLLVLITQDIDSAFRKKIVPAWSEDALISALRLYKDRVKTLLELRDTIVRLAHLTPTLDRAYSSTLTETQVASLELLYVYLSESEYVRHDLEQKIKQVCQEQQVKMADIAQPLRVALTGSSAAPGVYDLLLLLGKQESLQRLQNFLNEIKATR